MFSETNWLGKLFQFGTVFIAMELLMTSSSCPRNYSWHRRHVNTSYSWHRRLFSWRRRLIPIFYRATVYYIGIVSLKCVAVRICYCWGYIHVQYQTWTVLTAPTICLQTFEARTAWIRHFDVLRRRCHEDWPQWIHVDLPRAWQIDWLIDLFIFTPRLRKTK